MRFSNDETKEQIVFYEGVKLVYIKLEKFIGFGYADENNYSDEHIYYSKNASVLPEEITKNSRSVNVNYLNWKFFIHLFMLYFVSLFAFTIGFNPLLMTGYYIFNLAKLFTYIEHLNINSKFRKLSNCSDPEAIGFVGKISRDLYFIRTNKTLIDRIVNVITFVLDCVIIYTYSNTINIWFQDLSWLFNFLLFVKMMVHLYYRRYTIAYIFTAILVILFNLKKIMYGKRYQD
jgi:hypothetical protein